MKIAVVGATGMVGKVMLKVLAERNFPLTELIPVASEKSVGKEIDFKGKKYNDNIISKINSYKVGRNSNGEVMMLRFKRK